MTRINGIITMANGQHIPFELYPDDILLERRDPQHAVTAGQIQAAFCLLYALDRAIDLPVLFRTQDGGARTFPKVVR